MTAVAALREEAVFEPELSPASRGEALARYRLAREISRRHNANLLEALPKDAIFQHARRLGMYQGKTLVLDDWDDLTLAVDLAIHTAPPGRSRAIDRYVDSVGPKRDSEEAIVLEAMREARFAILLIRERHPAAGVIVTDLFRKTDLWLMDEGLELSMPDNSALATRYYTIGPFIMTAGVCLPIGREALEWAIESTPQLMRKPYAEAIQDRRFAEAVYRGALEDGTMGRVQLRDVPSRDRET